MSTNNQNANEVNITKATNSLWLVKVPNYIAKKWETQADNQNIGTFNIFRQPNEEVKMSIHLSEEIPLNDVGGVAVGIGDGAATTNQQQTLSKEYKINIEPIKEQLMTVFTEENSIGAADTIGEVKLTGYLSQKVNIISTADDNYMTLKKNTIRQAFTPKRTSMQLNSIVKNFKPITEHKLDIEQRKKQEQKSRKYRTQEEIMSILFDAFSKQRFYNIRDLMKITAVPMSALKLALKEICEYIVKSPNRNMWQLKPEYRHYNEENKNE